ncbi:MAG: PHP domain-containing protein [Candidatus Gastranaerophilales bacterium]|nr:PHP domain-containing protein [Candidatus Gastranaerophilales bacterium]
MHNKFKYLKNLKKADFIKENNLHIHTKFSDGILSPQEAIDRAKSIGFRTISITDHNTIEAYNHIDLLNTNGVDIISGIEFDCWHAGVLLHIIGYGIDLHNQELQNLCAKNLNGTSLDIVRFFNNRKAKDVIKTIKNAGGIAVLAHPACCWAINLKHLVKILAKEGLEGIEVYYPYKRHRGIIKFHTVNAVQKIANDLNLYITGGTDCHDTDLSW